MKSSAPWSVKGIERDARETAKEAAKREGMTVGEWLNQIIYQSGAPENSDGEIEGLKLRDIVTAIEHLNNHAAQAEAKNAEAVRELTRNVGGMVERVQRLERVKPPEGSNIDLSTRLEKLEKSGGDRQRIDALKALEKAVTQIATQFSSTHKSSLQRLNEHERQLQELSTRIETAHMSDAGGAMDTSFVEQTGEHLRVLGDEIKRGEDQIRGFEQTIAKLSAQIDAAERRSAEGVQKITDVVSDLSDQFGAGAKHKDAPTDGATAIIDTDHDAEPETLAAENFVEDTSLQIDANIDAAAKGGLDRDDDDQIKLADERQFMVDDTSAENDEIEAAIEDPSETGDDFSIDLDESLEDNSQEEGSREAKSLLSEIQEVFSGLRPASQAQYLPEIMGDAADDETRPPMADPDISLTGDLNAVIGALDGKSTQKEQSLSTETDDKRKITKALLFSGAPSITKQPVDDLSATSTANADGETSLAQAHQPAKKPAEESATANPTRRTLTPKQRAILAARARQKRLSEGQRQDTLSIKAKSPIPPTPEPTIPPQTDDYTPTQNDPGPQSAEDLEEQPHDDTVITKLKSFIANLPLIGRRDDEDLEEETENNKADDPSTIQSELMGKEADPSSLKASTVAKPVTLALGVAILLAAAALFYLVSDLVTKSPNAPAPRQAAPTTTTNTPNANSANTGIDNSNAATANPQPSDLPTIDPRTLYLDSMAGLNKASSSEEMASALATLEQSAALGHPPAQLQLGELYKIGQGVEQDLGQARTWFRRSANGGNVLAMHRIGVMTARGDGGLADTSEAIGWFELAANRGLIDSQYNLGAIYHPTNSGSASSIQDAGQAYYWYSLAAINGDDQAAPLAASVGGALTLAERNQIDGQITAWAALPTDVDANELADGDI